MMTRPKNPKMSNAEKALMDNKSYQKSSAAVEGRTNSTFMKGGAKPKAMYGKVMKASMMKTGGVVNSNAKVIVDNTPGSKGVKSGTNAKISASKKAKGRVGGKSKAPKKANP